MSLFSPFYHLLDLLFQRFFNLLPGNEKLSLMLGIYFVSLVIAALTTAVTARVIDQEEMKHNKEMLKEFQERLRKAREKGDEKRMKKISEEMMEVQAEVMKNSFKPMLYTLIPIIVVFSWLRQYAPLQNFISDKGYLVLLPFSMPRLPFGWHPGGPHLGWLGWYIVCSFMTSALARKIFKVHM